MNGATECGALETSETQDPTKKRGIMTLRKPPVARSITTFLMLGLLLFALAVAPAVRPAEAAFPGGTGRIAFMSDRDGDLDIYTMNQNGGKSSS